MKDENILYNNESNVAPTDDEDEKAESKAAADCISGEQTANVQDNTRHHHPHASRPAQGSGAGVVAADSHVPMRPNRPSLDATSSPTNDDAMFDTPPMYEAYNLKVIYQRNRTGFEEHRDFPIRVNDLIAGRYQIVEYLGSAAFSRAVQCLDLKTNQMVCVKIIRNNKDFLDQGMDEIKLLHYLNTNGDPDENRVVRLFDYFYFKEHLMIVCELLRDNLYEFSKYNRESEDELYFTLYRLQRIAWQVLLALRYIHSLRLIHCDLKPENILIKSYSRCEVKVIDFGSSCFITDHLSSYVQSRCYRSPEVVLGLPWDYTIDIWSLGAILPELLTGRVLFHNTSLPTMLVRIESICGTFPPHMLSRGRHTSKFFSSSGVVHEKNSQTGEMELLYPKHTSLKHRLSSSTDDPLFLDFIEQMLQIDPKKRLTAEKALHHPFFRCVYPN
jgi:serine/threonine protein kinase